LPGKLRKIVLSNDVAAERILHFGAPVLPAKEAMLYLVSVFYPIGARADLVLEQ